MSEVVDTARPWPQWMLDHMLRDDEATLQALLGSVARSPPDGGIAPDEARAVRELVEAYRGAGRAPETCYDMVRPFLRRQPERLRMLELFRCFEAIASRPDGYPLAAADEGLAIAHAMREPAAVGLFQLFQAGVSIRAGAHEDAAQRSLEALEMLLQAASARPACAPRIRAAARNAVLLTARGGGRGGRRDAALPPVRGAARRAPGRTPRLACRAALNVATGSAVSAPGGRHRRKRGPDAAFRVDAGQRCHVLATSRGRWLRPASGRLESDPGPADAPPRGAVPFAVPPPARPRTSPMPPPTHPHLKAALWMAGWLSAMVVLAVAGRAATGELAVFQIMEMRSVIGLALLYPLVRAQGGFAAMRSARPLQHVARNVVHYGAQWGWFYALTLIPLAQVVAIEFTMPIWTALLAVALLGERMNTAKSIAVALGLVGVAIIVRPDAGTVNPGQAIALAAAVGFAVSLIMVKSLTRSDSAVAIIFWMLVVQSVLGVLPALAVWRWPSAPVLGWVLVIAVCGTFSHYCLTRAMQHADATVVVPMDFLRVPLTAIAGWLVYAERIDGYTVLGAGLILFANLLNLRRAVPARASAASR